MYQPPKNNRYPMNTGETRPPASCSLYGPDECKPSIGGKSADGPHPRATKRGSVLDDSTLPPLTDVIAEAMAPDGEEFGEDRLIAAGTNSSTRSVTDMQLELRKQVNNFSHSRMHDDAMLIVISQTRANSKKHKEEPGALNSSEQLMHPAGAQP